MEVTAWTRAAFDVTSGSDVHAAIVAAKVEAVVHLAAWTNVDGAEADPDTAMKVNRDGAAHVAAACRSAGATCIYVSSDYVLQGDRDEPLPPGAPVRPRGVYAMSKAAGEAEVRDAGGAWLIARTGWVYGPGGRNFIDTMRALAGEGKAVRVVDDQHGAPTSTRLIAGVLRVLLAGRRTGIWHVAPAGSTTWYHVARAVYAAAGADVALVSPCTTAEAGRAAPRPGFSVLDTDATAQALGHALPPWQRDVKAYVATGTLPGSAWENGA